MGPTYTVEHERFSLKGYIAEPATIQAYQDPPQCSPYTAQPLLSP
ncbi:MAG: hypothetical protein Q6L60_04690 [Thermostichus sp. HHBFW_bins_43]